MNKYLGKENVTIDKTSFKPSTWKEKQPKVNLNRFYFRRNTADWTKQKTETSKRNKVPLKEISNVVHNFYPSGNTSTKHLDPVKERQSEQRSTIKNRRASEVTSNESTPRIEDEEIVINTLQGGYSEAIKKSFHDKNLCSNSIGFKFNKL